MARGRVITPEFWTDGNMVACSPFARLFYIGMWNFAYCDNGHLPDDALGLKLKILPADDVDAVALLGELMASKRVVRVGVEGRTFLYMPTFEGHQKADQRWKTRCPACALQNSLELIETLESFTEHAETHQSSALREEKRTREKRNAHQTAGVTFDDFWTVWPRKDKKKDAETAWGSAVKREVASVIVAKATEYANHPFRVAKQFVPYGATWLRGDRWNDPMPEPPESERLKPAPLLPPRDDGPMCPKHPEYPIWPYPCEACKREEL